jgi:hypothetical protein
LYSSLRNYKSTEEFEKQARAEVNESENKYDSGGVLTNPNPHQIIERMDNRGPIELRSS